MLRNQSRMHSVTQQNLFLSGTDENHRQQFLLWPYLFPMAGR